MLISVIVTTFNRPKALNLVLQALDKQTDKNFEVIVADDGSKSETQDLIDCLRKRVKYNLVHVWQEDSGFRAALVRNKAVLSSRGEYILFLDGDCIPPILWIARHRRLAEKGWMVAGNRILLSKNFTKKIEYNNESVCQWNIMKWILCSYKKLINRWSPMLYLPLGVLRKIGSRKWEKVRTCNFGVWREDFFRVNGFDSLFEGWGFEDSDLAVRLINSGVKRKLGSYASGVIHLWHAEFDRSRSKNNNQILIERIKNNIKESTIGLKQLTP